MLTFFYSVLQSGGSGEFAYGGLKEVLGSK